MIWHCVQTVHEWYLTFSALSFVAPFRAEQTTPFGHNGMQESEKGLNEASVGFIFIDISRQID